MPSSRFVFSLCFSFFFMPICHRIAFAQPNFEFYFCLNDRGNYTTNSTYKANLDHLLATFTTDHQIDYGFYNFSYGHDDKANAIGLCRGDLVPDACRSCLNDSIALLTKLCPTQKEAIGWYGECMLRYSYRSLSGFAESDPAFYAWNANNASDQSRFTQVARNMLVELISKAASGDSRLKFAAGNTAVPNLPTIYGAVQCTPDLSQQDCSRCLLEAIAQIRQCCDGKAGGRVCGPSCNFRFESYRFILEALASAPTASTPPPLPSNTPAPAKGNAFRAVIIIVVSIIVVVVVGVVLIFSIRFFLRTRKPRRPRSFSAKSPLEDEITEEGFSQFDFDSMRIATNEFSDANKLGEGGFGIVYKGRLPNGQNIAVKRLSRGSSQADDEFKNEILLVAKLQHRNLVQLLGFCFNENEKLLIYELVENSSLEKFLFNPVKRMSLDWKIRYNIISDIARGLVYLHEDSQLRIIHRDLKASNILLDANMNAKISDFGTARLFVHDQTRGDTRRIIGTYGYMAPEYVMKGHFSVKSDVFSFGVLILEIVTGQKNNRAQNRCEIVESLISYAWRNWRKGRVVDIIDPCLKSGGSRTEMVRCIQVGLLCVEENLAKRPTMANVLLMLDSYSVTLPRPSQPAFFINSSFSWQSQSEHNSAQEPNDNITISDLYPR